MILNLEEPISLTAIQESSASHAKVQTSVPVDI